MNRAPRLALVVAFAAITTVVGNVDAARAQELPRLERGDTGTAVELWQDHLREWLGYARPAVPITDDRGTFGETTEEATRELQRFVDSEPDGVVTEATWLRLYDRTGDRAALVLRRSADVTPAWPIPVPRWYWAWARWYLGRGEFQGNQRNPSVRPPAAPTRIPNWGWRRMLVTNGDDLEQQAVKLVQDRVRSVFGETLRMPPDLKHSEVEGDWILVTSSLVGHDQGPIAAWLRLVRGRWVPWNLGRVFPEQPERPQANDDPRYVPCDLRPLFEEPRC